MHKKISQGKDKATLDNQVLNLISNEGGLEKKKSMSYSFDLCLILKKLKFSIFFPEHTDSFMHFQTVWDFLGSSSGILHARPGAVYCSQMSSKRGYHLLLPQNDLTELWLVYLDSLERAIPLKENNSSA